MMVQNMQLFFLTEDRSITRKIFQLFEGDNDDLLGSVNFQDFHIIADRMTKSITDHEFLVVGKHHFDPILHNGLLSPLRAPFNFTRRFSVTYPDGKQPLQFVSSAVGSRRFTGDNSLLSQLLTTKSRALNGVDHRSPQPAFLKPVQAGNGRPAG